MATASLSATNPTGRTRHIRDGGQVHKQFHWLAIARYEDQPGVYLFYCAEDWTVVTDTYHDTVEGALDQARYEFENVCFAPLSQST